MIRLLLKIVLPCTLFVSVCAASAISQAAAAPDRLPVLIAEASAQFKLAYRSQPAEGDRRQQQLNAVIAAWHAAPRSEANNEQLNNWLRTAIRSSMPGSRESLPALPTFAGGPERQPHSATPATAIVRTPPPAAQQPKPTVKSN